jgi:hypothetical protein
VIDDLIASGRSGGPFGPNGRRDSRIAGPMLLLGDGARREQRFEMATQMAHRPTAGVEPRGLGTAGKITIAALIWLGIGALAGGIALVTRPDGSAMGFETSILAGSPFHDFLVPGLILGGLFGLGSFVVAFLGLRHHPLAPLLAFGIGCGQMIWIVVQLAIIQTISFLHPLMFATGLVIAVGAVFWSRFSATAR